MTSYDSLPPIVEGELVDIHLRRARVLTVSEDRRYMQVETPTGYRLLIDRTRLDIDRVAPKEWPPQIGDVWADQNGDEWIGAGAGHGIAWLAHLDDARGTWKSPDEALQRVGRLTLVRRRGWTPAEPDEEKPVELDERSATIVGLRDMADFLEANDDLPRSYGWNGQLKPESEQHLRDMAEHFGATIRRDDEEATAADICRGRVTLTLYYPKPKLAPATPVVDEPTGTAGLVPRQDSALVDADDVDRWEHDGGRPLVDDGDGDGDTNDPHCSSWLKEPGTDHTHRCALYASGAPHDWFKHICAVDGCGRQWTDDDRDEPSLPADLGQHDETDVIDRGIL